MSGLSNVIGGFGDELEKGVKNQLQVTSQAIKAQFVPQQQSQMSQSDTGSHEAGSSGQQSTMDPAIQEFVKDMYGSSKGQTQKHGFPNDVEKNKFVQEKIKQGMKPEDAAKLESLRKKLHDETYYFPLTQRKPIEVAQQEEEQKKEQEKMQELQEKEEKKKKNAPIAVQMGAMRAEKFPGASG
jgi:hypothetical protein